MASSRNCIQAISIPGGAGRVWQGLPFVLPSFQKNKVKCESKMKKDERKGEKVSVQSLVNRPENKRTFITLSLILFLTCREEKNTVLIQHCTLYSK
jgi:hypothetical protein